MNMQLRELKYLLYAENMSEDSLKVENRSHLLLEMQFDTFVFRYGKDCTYFEQLGSILNNIF